MTDADISDREAEDPKSDEAPDKGGGIIDDYDMVVDRQRRGSHEGIHTRQPHIPNGHHQRA